MRAGQQSQGVGRVKREGIGNQGGVTAGKRSRVW